MKPAGWLIYRIAGLSIRLRAVEPCRRELEHVYQEFDRRCRTYKSEARNPHLCCAGCSHCCRQGAFFAVSLVEAVCLTQAVRRLPDEQRRTVDAEAHRLLRHQQHIFSQTPGPADCAGKRDEETFSARVSRVNRTVAPSCPLLDGDLCGIYDDRPFLCRAYGFPVDAYAVKGDDAVVFRSLCQLYADKELADYVRAEDLKARLAEISRALADGIGWGRFTSAEAMLARLQSEPACAGIVS